MKALIHIVGIILLVATFQENVLAQVGTNARVYKEMQKLDGHFLQYEKDLNDFQKSLLGSDQFQAISDAAHVLEVTQTHVDAMLTMLSILSKIRSRSDRESIKPIMEDEINHYINMTNLDVEELNLSLSTIDKPGITDTIQRAKDDCRSFIDMMRKIELR